MDLENVVVSVFNVCFLASKCAHTFKNCTMFPCVLNKELIISPDVFLQVAIKIMRKTDVVVQFKLLTIFELLSNLALKSYRNIFHTVLELMDSFKAKRLTRDYSIHGLISCLRR